MISIRNLVVRVGAFSLDGVSFEVPARSYAAMMGRTGSGKTTILEAICGLRTVQSGQIVLNGRDVTRLKPAERGIGFVPQDGALFKTMTVRDHLAFALMIRKWPKPAIDARVDELVHLLSINHLMHRKPHGLSGGERQRVALGRALSAQPAILCLDEPLSALDDDTRQEMYQLLAQVRRDTGVTTLHVTHSQSEADHLADVVLQVSNRKVQVVGSIDAAP